MKSLGQKMNQYGQTMGQQLSGGGMSLGSKLSLHTSRSHAPNQSAKVHKSDLERGGNHVPKEGQESFTHGLGLPRQPWQRKKNH